MYLDVSLVPMQCQQLFCDFYVYFMVSTVALQCQKCQHLFNIHISVNSYSAVSMVTPQFHHLTVTLLVSTDFYPCKTFSRFIFLLINSLWQFFKTVQTIEPTINACSNCPSCGLFLTCRGENTFFRHTIQQAHIYINPNPCGYINWRCRTAWSHIWPPGDQ
jgi:hypothetical protein